MRRPAYILKLNASHHEISKFERRGVKVINIVDKKLNYSKLFEGVFTELDIYWKDRILKTGTFTQEETLSEILTKDDSKNRLCFFSIPFQLLSFYKQNVFPIAESYGFVPITADEVLTPGDTILAKIAALIDKSEILIMDVSGKNNNVLLELGMATAKKDNKSKILVIKDKNEPIPSDIPGALIIEKPQKLFTDYEAFFHKIESWFSEIASEYNQYFEDEPSRLLKKSEFRAAVVSAISLLEKGLRNTIVLDKTQLRFRTIPLYQMVRIALEQKLIDEKDYIRIRQGLDIRNTIVHSLKDSQVTKEKAKSVVVTINKVVKELQLRTGDSGIK